MNLLEKTCEYIMLIQEESQCESVESRIAKKVLSGTLTDEQIEFATEILSEGSQMKYVKSLITKPSEKKYTFSFNTPTEYYPTETPMDDTTLYNGEPHYIYIHSETKGRWGDTYWISNNCSSSLCALPVIKAFKEFDFEVGKFYRIECIDTIFWGNNKKKYVMDIRESSEEEFLEKGFRFDAYDNGFFEKCYIQELLHSRGYK